MADETKELIASSEFDPSNFVRGIDQMTAALEKLSKEEDSIRAELKNINAALAQNRQEYKTTTTDISNLDKSSKTYKDDLQRLTAQKKLLTAQQKELKASMDQQKASLAGVNEAANTYRGAVEEITQVTKEAVAAGKGASFFDTANLQKQVAEISAASSQFKNIFQGKIPTEELDKFEQELSQTNDEFEQLGKTITFVKSKLDTLDPNTQEFQDLNRVVDIGEEILLNYGKATEQVDKKSTSLRTRLAALRTSLSDLESAGKENTKEFEAMAIEAGKLQDQMEDTQARIKVLASDTKALDFGIQSIRGVAAAFGVAEGAAALFGLKSEDVAKSLQRLNAIMLVLNGLQELQTILQKQSVVAVIGQEIATKAAATAQRIYAFTIGTTTGALKAFRIALLGTGILGIITLVGVLAAKFLTARNAVDDTAKKYKLLNDVVKESNEEAGKQIASLNILIKASRDVNLPLEDRLKAVQALQKEFPEYFGNLSKEAILTGDITKETDALTASIIAAARARAAKGKIDAIESERLDVAFKKEKVQNDLRAAQLQKEKADKKDARDAELRGLDQFDAQSKESSLKKELADNEARDRQLKSEAEFLTKFVGIGELAKTVEDPAKETKNKTDKKTKEIENEFARKKAELDQQLAEATRKEADNESKIRIEFAARLQKELLEIQKLFTEKKLTAPQVEILSKEAVEINEKLLDNALKDFQAKILKFRNDFDKKLFDLQLQSGKEQAELIRDEFVRDSELLKQETEIQANALIKDRDDLIKSINAIPGIIPEIKEEAILQVENTYAQLLENLSTQTARKQEEISARVFESLQDQTKTIFANVQLLVSETATVEIQQATEEFTKGKINYTKYQKELTRIATEETDRRIATQLREAQQLLTDVQKQIPQEKDPKRLKELQDQERELRARIAELNKELSLAQGQEIKKDQDLFKQRVQAVATYAEAIGGIINQVVSFWQQVNQAEQASLEKSIALQEKRVEAATRIAERGNSEYLRLEEDRLQELQVKQENAARRQLAVNAVLQTSQAITAFISALAQGIALGGPLGGIAIASAVIAAIASGYAIVQSLQPPTQTFKTGTKYVEGKGSPEGVDTVPAKLTKGEAVFPVDINRDYHPAVKAIFDRKIPAKEINNFVNNYRVNQRVLPTVNYEKMSEATQVMISYDGELLQATKEQTRKIDENTDLLRRVEFRLKNMGVEVNMDSNGFAMSIMKAADQIKIDKRT